MVDGQLDEDYNNFSLPSWDDVYTYTGAKYVVNKTSELVDYLDKQVYQGDSGGGSKKEKSTLPPLPSSLDNSTSLSAEQKKKIEEEKKARQQDIYNKTEGLADRLKEDLKKEKAKTKKAIIFSSIGAFLLIGGAVTYLIVKK